MPSPNNSFSQEERVDFESMLLGFDDNLVYTDLIRKYMIDQQMLARSNDTIWRPQPYIAATYDGTDATANFRKFTQLSVPVSVSYHKHAAAVFTPLELRDALQENRVSDSAKQKLASDINAAIMRMAATQSTLAIKRTTAAKGFDDVALIEAMMNESGIGYGDRNLALSTRDYNSMASDLASRQTMDKKPATAFERAYVGTIASFDTYKMDYAFRLPVAGGSGVTIDTRDAGANYYIPKSTSVATTGESSNVDNRYHLVTVSSTTGVNAGDIFTLTGVNAVHHITKNDTGELKTYRVIKVNSSTTMTVSPPIISNQVASDASGQYQNCVVNTKSSTSAIVWLNTALTAANIFWHKDAFEMIPGRYIIPSNAGIAVNKGTTEQGIEIVVQKAADIDTNHIKYRWDIHFGLACIQPEMCGIILFNQT